VLPATASSKYWAQSFEAPRLGNGMPRPTLKEFCEGEESLGQEEYGWCK